MKPEDRSNICTWNNESGCASCGLRGRLNCRWDIRALRFFLAKEVPPLIVALFGMTIVGIVVGVWWALAAFVIACVVLWGFGVETRVLCSHCPYYAEEGKILHCLALHGTPKFWRYRPEPMNRVEKTILISFFSFLLLWPVFVEAYGIWFISAHYGEFGLVGLLGMIGVTLATVMGGVLWLVIMSYTFCSKCVNFSCPLNQAPKPIVDAYLQKNPVMKDAWLRSGYKLGG